MPRFLHTADWQIGRQFGQFESDDAARLVAARLDSVSNIGRKAVDLAVDAVLVAGDIFDVQTVSDKLLRRTFQAMEAYRGKWILLPGNHDAALADCVWTRCRDFGLIRDNIDLLDRPVIAQYPELGFAVLPAPLTQRQTAQDLTEWFDTASTADGLIRIGLAHGSVTGRLPDVANATNPIASDRATTARLDYLALGDWHGCLQIDSRTWYSGTPEADRYRTLRPGNILHVSIEQSGASPKIEILATGRFQWHRHLVDFDHSAGLEQLHDMLATLGEQDVLRLKLSGQLTWEAGRQLGEALDRSGARLAACDIDRSGLRLVPAEEEIGRLQADGYLGRVLSELREEAADQYLSNGEPAAAAESASPVILEALTILSDTLSSRRGETGAK